MSESYEFTDEQLRKIGEHLADILDERRGVQAGCTFTAKEKEDLRSLLKTKKAAAAAVLWVSGAVFLWILKGAYDWIVRHLSWSGS